MCDEDSQPVSDEFEPLLDCSSALVIFIGRLLIGRRFAHVRGGPDRALFRELVPGLGCRLKPA
jgi:hypothetical protein